MMLSDFLPDEYLNSLADRQLSMTRLMGMLNNAPVATEHPDLLAGLRAVYNAVPAAVMHCVAVIFKTETTLTFRLSSSEGGYREVDLEVSRDEIINTPPQVAGKLLLLA